MGHKYTDVEFDFIKNNCKCITSYELVARFNKHFNTELTRSQIRAYMKNHNLKSDIDRKDLKEFHKSIYTDEQKEFIKDNVTGRTSSELTIMFNKHFGVNVELASIRAFINNHGLKSGLDCRFKAGSVPANKGMKGICGEGCEKTWFKKGTIPPNHRPIGSERITVDGYTEVKIAEPKRWRLKQQLVWEEHNGKIPRGYAVIFGDGDQSNFDINNLILVSRQQLLVLNRYKLIQNDADLTRTGVIIADLYAKVSEVKKAR